MNTMDIVPRKTVLTLRPDERRRLDEAARQADYRSTSDFIRRMALKAADEIRNEQKGALV